ncbi:peptidoglycan-binding domain-containing protein [Aestuariispira insulae]|uniref:peptidoglycan-binding domain-containing protein n=1 Tax=Aestuariispira insulae TaxID=1461337 RepID=UPI0015F2608D|nr:peptidoglycan-binding domain-containing protein [Aestuariispira insulae]
MAGFILFASGQAQAASPKVFDETRETGWSQLVLDLQREFSEMGLYSGQVNGFPDTQLLDVIVNYQEQHRLPVDGRPSPDLLDHIRTRGRPENLLSNLKKQKTEDQEWARTALLKNEATRDLVSLPVPREVADPTRNLDRCLTKPTVNCLINEALESAKAVNKPEMRQWVFRDIMKAQSYSGRFDEARLTIRRLEDPRLMLVALQEQVAVLAHANRLDDAHKLAHQIPDTATRLKALAELLVATPGNRALTSEILKTANALPDHLDRINILTTLAPRIWREREPENAMIILDHALSESHSLQDGSERENALIMIAGAKAAMGDEGALEQAIFRHEKKKSLRYLAVALCDLAIHRSRNGNLPSATALLKRARDYQSETKGFSSQYILARLAETEAHLGAFPAALTTAGSIEKANMKARTYWSIAMIIRNGQAKGDHDMQVEIDRLALDAMAAIKNDFDRITLLSSMAIQLMTQGDPIEATRRFKKALGLAGKVTNNWWRARAFGRLALVKAKLSEITLK